MDTPARSGPSRRFALAAALLPLIGCRATDAGGKAAGAGPVPSAPSAARARPHVVLAMTDDQGWGDVGYNGLRAIATPNLDAMAAAGLRFDRFYAAAPVCSPTRGAMLTGRHPNRYGTFIYGKPLRPQELTLAQVLRRAGYATGHFGKWHLEGRSGPGRPIPADDPLGPGRFGFDEWLSASNFFDIGSTLSRRGRPEPIAGDGSDYIVAQALAYIDEVLRRAQPFFVVIWFGNPHSPHRALPEDEKAAGGSAYYGEIVAIDRAMGALRAGLRARGVADDTLVWFTSDNGATNAGSTGGLRGRKGSLWEGGARVPGLLEWPARIRRPAVTPVPAVTSDIYPTIVEVLGLEVREQVQPLDGVSLVPLIDGAMAARPRPIGFWHHAGNAALTKDAGELAWTDNRYKLRRNAGAFELYDLVADAKEAHDLAAAQPEIVARMRRALESWQDSVLRSLGGYDYAAPAAVGLRAAR
jgi:arylsulfatase A-like enzyme